jgi:hypothetical protein
MRPGTYSDLEARLVWLEHEVRRLRDLEEIRQLRARHWQLCDGDVINGPTHDYEKLVDLFTEDGSWTLRTMGGSSGLLQETGAVGRASLLAWFRSTQQHVPFAMHFGMAPDIVVDEDRATGNWRVLATMLSSSNEALLAAATYDDVYVRTSIGWRVHSTIVTVGFNTPFADGWGKTRHVAMARG